jgi:aspartyl protease family protein
VTPDLIDMQSPYFWPAVIGGLVAFVILLRVPFIGTLIRTLISLVLIAAVVMLLMERAPFDPMLSNIAGKLNLDGQEVVGKEVRIRMSPDGHFRALVSINGVKRRMMIDSGATVTALSEDTAAEAGLRPQSDILPVVLQTANGMVPAKTATIDEMRIGNIVARDLKVVVTPALGNMNLLGMNFLSKLQSWRVEGRTLILVPHHPQPVDAT